MKPVLPHAQLDWDDQGRPRSRVFDDVYFSDKSGLEETRYVFLERIAWPSVLPHCRQLVVWLLVKPVLAPG
ncbi:hypothetical protein PMI19_00173 [Pseudomonas sp. GM16]|nr:hypothetical protein PMI19_00173 [Pseudomonas sp. GM16]